jgi:phosphate transport system protein
MVVLTLVWAEYKLRRKNCSPTQIKNRQKATLPGLRRKTQMIRQFDQSLKNVEQLLLDMGAKVEISIEKAVKSLASPNTKMAEQVLVDDKDIDQLEGKIDDVVAKLIATQQPVAKDLRKLIAVMKIASDMERMADLAVNIAEVTIELKGKNQMLLKGVKDISDMARITQKMVHDSINSFIEGNIELAKSLAKDDDLVDQKYVSIIKELTQYLSQQDQNFQVAFKLCFVARYLERIADHATNVAESIVYIETGKQIDLNCRKLRAQGESASPGSFSGTEPAIIMENGEEKVTCSSHLGKAGIR